MNRPLRNVSDMLGRKLSMQYPPQRMVSVVPSQTELLYHLGLDEEVVGITRFCVHPEEWFRSKIRVGGTKKLHFDKIRALQPDLIIANKEENRKEEIEALSEEFPVWVSDVKTRSDALTMIRQLSEICGKEEEGRNLAAEIELEFDKILRVQPLRTAYFIWEEPVMVVGGDTFIHDVLSGWGLHNIFEKSTRYPQITLEELEALRPELILLSSEPFPFAEKHRQHLRKRFPEAKVALVDGEMFSWYGSRMRLVPSYLNRVARTLEILK